MLCIKSETGSLFHIINKISYREVKELNVKVKTINLLRQLKILFFALDKEVFLKHLRTTKCFLKMIKLCILKLRISIIKNSA